MAKVLQMPTIMRKKFGSIFMKIVMPRKILIKAERGSWNIPVYCLGAWLPCSCRRNALHRIQVEVSSQKLIYPNPPQNNEFMGLLNQRLRVNSRHAKVNPI